MGKEQVVVGKRVTVGVGIGGLVTFGISVWEMLFPEHPVPANAAVGLTSFIVMASQLFVANKYGITTKESLGD